MCTLSMVGDFYGRTVPTAPFVWPPQPVFVPWPTGAPASLPWTQESFDLLKEVMEKLKALDEKLGLAECEDAEKTKWMKEIDTRLKKVEKAKK